MLSGFAVMLFNFIFKSSQWILEQLRQNADLDSCNLLLMRWSDWITWKRKILSFMNEKYTWGFFQEFSCKCISKLLVIVCLLLVNLNMKTRILHDSGLFIMSVNLYWVGIWTHFMTALPKTLFFMLLATRWKKKVIKTVLWCYQPSYPYPDPLLILLYPWF